MGKNEKHKPGLPGQAKMETRKVGPTVVITQDPNTGHLQVNANFKDWDRTEAMLIDGLQAAYRQRIKEKQSRIAVPQPQIIIPGS